MMKRIQMHKIENGRMQKRIKVFTPLGKLPHFFLRKSGGAVKTLKEMQEED